MATQYVTGFGGIRLAMESFGRSEDPAVLLLPGGGQTRAIWRGVAQSLAEAGRHVLSIDLRGHGESEAPLDGRYDIEAYIGDLRAVLATLENRPAIVAAALAGWIATACLGESTQSLATGLVVVDSLVAQGPAKVRVTAFARSHAPGAEEATLDDADLTALKVRLGTAARRLKVPMLMIRGSEAPPWREADAATFGETLATAEVLDLPVAGHRIATDQAEALAAAVTDFFERRIPREPPSFRAGSDPRTLRDALGCFATGVTIVTTTASDGTPVGLTANSFTSVSLDPPLLLVCIAKSAGSIGSFEACKAFAVNVLHIGQQSASNRFARKDEERFAATPWQVWDSGVPVIDNALASFECHRHALHDGGDHLILIGRVDRVRFEPRRDPLLYFRGRYRRLHFD